MRETKQDLVTLQALLDRSYDDAGQHLRDVLTADRRLTAQEVCAQLTGMNLLTLATSTADGRPLCGAVDAFFYRGSYWFGSSPHAVRMKHIAQRPHVSAVYLPGEHLSVTVHGRAFPAVDQPQRGLAGFREICVEYYGEEWLEWGDDAAYAYIEADRMFTFSLPENQG
ncbi:pyridoxamine 5'-phosphate oxidase [bacterium BMS3Bbin02]|nr:pyridoxamine 5'-phosphate oxidase [bacterium BMS3Bbin02]